MHGSTLHDDDVADVVSAGLDGATEDVLVVNPTEETVRELLRNLTERDSPPTTRALVADGLLSGLAEDFLVASVLADLVVEDTLDVARLPSPPNNALFVTDGTVTAVVTAGDSVGALSTSDPEFVEAARSYYESRWETAERFSPRTPPLSRTTGTLATDIGEEATADFEAILGSLDAARRDDGLSEVTISLLVAARNGVLLYDISKWGEDIGLASKATFSRTKTRLEEAGLVDTEKVPIEVGRPRLRLKLGDDRLAAVPPAEMAQTASDLLAEA